MIQKITESYLLHLLKLHNVNIFAVISSSVLFFKTTISFTISLFTLFPYFTICLIFAAYKALHLRLNVLNYYSNLG